MGLDITAYSHIVPTALSEDQLDADPALWDTHIHIWNDPVFRDRADGLQDGAYYRVEGDTLGFRAGSYSGYNQWRAILSRVMLDVPPETVWANPDRYVEAPFFALIHFSDCGGVIGSRTSACLAHDFARFAEKAATVPDAWWQEKYTLWHKAFALAAADGCVRFH